MNILFWVLQGVLAAMFLMSGGMKLSQPKEKLQPRMPYVEDFSANALRTIGAFEVLGALGLILPLALDIAPILTPIAATGLAVVMAGAVVVHIRRKEAWIVPAVLGVVAVAVAIYRF
jgi:uncharacterized membrane protein YphA (DoxX/SURF4 family)